MKLANKMDYKGLKVSMPIIGYGGMVHAQYMSSMIQLVNNCAAAGISVDCPLIWFESLISRARNSSAAAALSSNCDYLFFVDTDIIFNYKDFFKLLDADKDVAVGLYTKKYINERKLNALFEKFSQLPKVWKSLVGDFSSEFTNNTNEDIIKVEYAATGFMLIKTSVFKTIAEKMPELKYKNDIDAYMSYGDNFYDFFRCWVNPDNKKYESEDYGFCRNWHNCGGEIHAVKDINLIHRGNYCFEGNLKEQQKIFNP